MNAGRKTSLAAIAALGTGLFFTTNANAALSLSVSSSAGGAAFIVDEGPGDTALGSVGQITASVPGMGGYAFVNINAIFSNDPGAPAGATLQVTNISQRDFTPGAPTLTIDASDEGYFIPAGPGLTLQSSGGGTFTSSPGPASMTFQSFGDPANVLFAPTVPTPPQGFASPGSPSLISYDLGTTTSPFAAGIYSLTNRTTITLSTPGSLSNFSGSTIVVPEPATFGLLGLAGMALLRRRR